MGIHTCNMHTGCMQGSTARWQVHTHPCATKAPRSSHVVSPGQQASPKQFPSACPALNLTDHHSSSLHPSPPPSTHAPCHLCPPPVTPTNVPQMPLSPSWLIHPRPSPIFRPLCWPPCPPPPTPLTPSPPCPLAPLLAPRHPPYSGRGGSPG